MAFAVSRRAALPALAAFFAGVVVTHLGPSWGQPPEPRAPAAYRPESPPYRGLDASIYVQVAAEYRACCLQAYNVAAWRLKENLAAERNGKKPAVVMDLDETVLDNAGFQSMMLRSNLAFDQRLWDEWEQTGGDNVALVPGAGDFIHAAERLGVTVIQITNRNERSKPSAMRMLQRLDIPVARPDHLMMATTTTDKTARRRAAEAEFAVLLYVGDNLRDFDERYRSTVDLAKTPATPTADLVAAARRRKELVDQDRDKWGARWIILPNPVYGEWNKFTGRGERDLDLLAGKKP